MLTIKCRRVTEVGFKAPCKVILVRKPTQLRDLLDIGEAFADEPIALLNTIKLYICRWGHTDNFPESLREIARRVTDRLAKCAYRQLP